MIKKILICLICLISLAGCMKTTGFNNDIEKILNKATSVAIPDSSTNNCTKKYYSFNDVLDVTRVESSELYNIFKIEDCYCALNLDVTSIISYKIYSDANEVLLQQTANLKNPIFTKKGAYKNSSGETIPYQISVSKENEQMYCVVIQTSEFQFTSIVENDKLDAVIYDMMIVLRSVKVDRALVYLDFFDQNKMTSTTKTISLFDYISQSGYLIDNIEDEKGGSDFIIIDNSEKESILDEQTEDEDYPMGGEDNELN